jgi:hypothetical protein
VSAPSADVGGGAAAVGAAAAATTAIVAAPAAPATAATAAAPVAPATAGTPVLVLPLLHRLVATCACTRLVHVINIRSQDSEIALTSTALPPKFSLRLDQALGSERLSSEAVVRALPTIVSSVSE